MYRLEFENNNGQVEMIFNFKNKVSAERYASKNNIKWYVIQKY